MTHRIGTLIVALTILSLSISAPCLAHDGKEKTFTEKLQLLPPVAAEPEVDPERQWAIFRILTGGARSLDEELAEHLWQVAGSLSTQDWRPPTVRVSVVVRELPVRR
jgi:hypothetical protein